MGFTKEQLRERAREKVKSLEFAVTQAAFADSRAELEEELELARIALASMTAEPVGEVVLGEHDDCGCHPDARVACIAADGQADWENFKDGTRLYTAPPAPMLPEEMPKGLAGQIVSLLAHNIGDRFLAQKIWNACRAAMLQGADGNSPVIPDGWVMVPVDMPPEMMRAVQVNSELGAYAATNLNGAYSLFREFWDVAVTAAPQQEMNT
ncbi:hypothetical protein [Enterobacter cancerogenus]|uniref:hypothetical protein n=1 Tax=Enterobacter cancerogenus TaxID=69218 RepID=UPI0040591847